MFAEVKAERQSECAPAASPISGASSPVSPLSAVSVRGGGLKDGPTHNNNTRTRPKEDEVDLVKGLAAQSCGVPQISAHFVEQARDTPVEIRAVHYGLLSSTDIHRLSVLPCRRVIGNIRDFGVNDARLGVLERTAVCATCGQRSVECIGHPGHIDLELPVFHLGFLPTIVRICRSICKTCSHVLLSPPEMDYYTRRLRSSTLEPQQRLAMVKQLQIDAYKTRVCLHCGSINGVVRRVRPMRLVHEKYATELRRGEYVSDDASEVLMEEMHASMEHNPELRATIPFMHEFLDPARVKQLFMAVPPAQMILLGLESGTQPVDLLVSTLLVPPVCVRPRGISTTAHDREDDLTTQYNDILISSDALRDGTNDPTKYVENWEMLQSRVARLQDAAMPGFPAHLRSTDCKSYAQRMKGKHGRFRGNLSGKRVDFSGRSVISPDPNLEIDELAVPLRVARVLTYPQRVFSHNLELMRKLVRNGPDVHPGAMTVYLARENSRKSLYNFRDRQSLAARLAPGDVVERHVMNGDMILFNRQPSLHRISMMAHRARVLPYRTFRFNECCCSPYNADFDGDEMNVHVVQTEEARAEAKELMITSNNVISAKNGEPIIACTQDFLTAAYLVTSRDAFFDRAQFSQMLSHWLGAHTRYALPIPAILKPVELWTGKQLMQVILRPSPTMEMNLNLEAKARFYSGEGKHDDPAEGFVSFLDAVYISGRMDKKLLGGGAKDGLFARLYALAGGGYTARCMSRIAQFTSRYLQNYGFSLGLGDVAPTESLTARRAVVLARSFDRCDALIEEANSGRMAPLPGMTVKQSLEAMLNAELSKVRDECGSAAVEALDATSNAPLIMVQSGSKGSALNTAQMMACVGQQTVSGKRIVNAFQDRSLPHFLRFAEEPAARGFVANSFFAGLSPTEFFFHTMAGREGLVDTAVKTAETGYIYRRLSKAMENLSVQYDYTVRNALQSIIQLRYGEDGMDPWLMEGANGAPLNLDQEWLGSRAAYARTCQTRIAFREQYAEQVGNDEDDATHAQHTSSSSPSSLSSSSAIPNDVFDEWFVQSLLPAEVHPFVERCLNGEAAMMAKIREVEQFIRREDVAIDQWKRSSSSSSSSPSSATKRERAPLPMETLVQLAKLRSQRFVADVERFFYKKVEELLRLRRLLELPVDARHATSSRGYMESLQTELLPLAPAMVVQFLEECGHKYLRKRCEPGTPCGAIAAQSVGEPSTQMTLRTFHFAGVASMNITQGVPRLVEIINANKNISTPVVTAPIVALEAGEDAYDICRRVKGHVERVLLKEVTTEMVEVMTASQYYIHIRLNMALIRAFMLPMNASTVRERILAAAGRPMSPLRLLREDNIDVVSHDSLIVYSYESDPRNVQFNLQYLLAMLPELVVGGIAGINRVMIAKDHTQVVAEGAELRAVMSLPFVDGTRTMCNHVAVAERVLGIEAARQLIVGEIGGILQAYSLSIDVRHVYLLADLMTHRGVVLGITRYGIQKMNNNVLTMASFERTTEHLYNAAMMQRSDSQLSVSECIILGKPVQLGTSAFSLLLDHPDADTRTSPQHKMGHHHPRTSSSGEIHLKAEEAASSNNNNMNVVAENKKLSGKRRVVDAALHDFFADAHQRYALHGGFSDAKYRRPPGSRRRPHLAEDGVFHLDLFR